MNYLFLHQVTCKSKIRTGKHAEDNRPRLTTVSHLFTQGKRLFPRKGAEEFLNQLLYFGKEKHDDLSDAFSISLSQVVKKDHDDWDNE